MDQNKVPPPAAAGFGTTWAASSAPAESFAFDKLLPPLPLKLPYSEEAMAHMGADEKARAELKNSDEMRHFKLQTEHYNNRVAHREGIKERLQASELRMQERLQARERRMQERLQARERRMQACRISQQERIKAEELATEERSRERESDDKEHKRTHDRVVRSGDALKQSIKQRKAQLLAERAALLGGSNGWDYPVYAATPGNITPMKRPRVGLPYPAETIDLPPNEDDDSYMIPPCKKRKISSPTIPTAKKPAAQA